MHRKTAKTLTLISSSWNSSSMICVTDEEAGGIQGSTKGNGNSQFHELFLSLHFNIQKYLQNICFSYFKARSRSEEDGQESQHNFNFLVGRGKLSAQRPLLVLCSESFLVMFRDPYAVLWSEPGSATCKRDVLLPS